MYIYTYIYICILLVSTTYKTWKQPKCPLTDELIKRCLVSYKHYLQDREATDLSVYLSMDI